MGGIITPDGRPISAGGFAAVFHIDTPFVRPSLAVGMSQQGPVGFVAGGVGFVEDAAVKFAAAIIETAGVPDMPHGDDDGTTMHYQNWLKRVPRSACDLAEATLKELQRRANEQREAGATPPDTSSPADSAGGNGKPPAA